MSVTVLFSRYDAQRLAGAVGTERAAQLVNAEETKLIFRPGS